MRACPHRHPHRISLLVETALAVVFALLGGLIAVTGAQTGTCTGNDAGNLFLLIFALPFYAIALGLALFAMSARAILATALLLSPLLLWQAAFALNLGFRIVVLDQTACEILWRAPYGPDGSELTYALLWLGTGLGFPVLLALALWRKKAKP